MKVSAVGLAAGAGAPEKTAKSEKVAELAREFEALLLRQLLASAKVCGATDRQDAYAGMASDALADALARGGGTGLAGELERALSRQVKQEGQQGPQVAPPRTVPSSR